MEAGYFGEVLGRPFVQPLPWMVTDAAPSADMWVPAEKPRDEIVDDLSHRVWAQSETTIGELASEGVGTVELMAS